MACSGHWTKPLKPRSKLGDSIGSFIHEPGGFGRNVKGNLTPTWDGQINIGAMKQTKRILFLGLFLPLLITDLVIPARAEVKPNSLFSDGVVLQQGVAVSVWGTAKDGEMITVKFQDQTLSTTAKDGRWMVKLKPLKVGGPYSLSIRGENEVTVKDVLVGEVWLCSGQSNMAFALSRASNAQEAIAAAADPQLR